jgi:hypothetical protein
MEGQDEVEVIGPKGKRVMVSKYLANQTDALRAQGFSIATRVIPAAPKPLAPPVRMVEDSDPSAVEVPQASGQDVAPVTPADEQPTKRGPGRPRING